MRGVTLRGQNRREWVHSERPRGAGEWREGCSTRHTWGEKSPIMGRPTDAPVSLTEMEVKWRFM